MSKTWRGEQRKNQSERYKQLRSQRQNKRRTPMDKPNESQTHKKA